MTFRYDKLRIIIKTAAITLISAALASSGVTPLSIPKAETAARHLLKKGLSTEFISLIGDGGSYIRNGYASRLDFITDEKQIAYGAAKLRYVIDKYLGESNIYLSIIPDKNYFLTADGLYPHLDYSRLVGLTCSGIPDATYIDLFGLLSADDYYRTDAHWDQRTLPPIAQVLADAMGLGAGLSPEGGYTEHKFFPFDGLYTRRYQLPLKPDTLYWLTSAAIDSAFMTGAGFEGDLPIYTDDKLDGTDAYDIFAGGPQSVLTIISPNAKTDRELIMFRDSFGSSLAPLLLEGYAKVTLIDLRYIPAVLLSKYVDFHGQDVLFLYSTTLLNSAMVIK